MGNSKSRSQPVGGLGARVPPVVGLGEDVQLVGELGSGAHTAVYRLRRAGTDYALKVLRQGGADDEAALARFHREAALLARVDHPGVPRVFDVGSGGGRPYLVLEFIDGESLSGRLESGPIGEAELVRLAGDVAAALAAAHRAGLVHRDIKPDNVIVTGSGRARLIDFGLAVAGDVRPSGDALVGTFDYAAPEQTGMLARPVDGRADLYALGVVMFECATGELPFQADDVGELLAMHTTVPAPDPRRLRADLSPPLAELILRLLAKDPDDRVQSARDLCAELGRLSGGAGPVGDAGPASLVGRGRELAALRNRWRRARAGGGGTVLLHGPAGTGKTSLAAELASTVRAEGAIALSGRCDRASELPLAPLRAAVDGYVRMVAGLSSGERDAAVSALREAAGLGAGLLRPLSSALAALLEGHTVAAEERHEQFGAAVAAFLATLATGRGGLLLVLDDVQWLDPASRAVLRRLTEESAESEAPVLVVATARDGDDDALAEFTAAAGERLDLRLPVGPLDDEGAVELISAYLSGAVVSPEVAAELSARGRGNPFTLLEYLHALVEAGALRPSWGTWRLDPDRLRAVDLPGDVFELVLGRIAGLAGPAREILTVAAALGSRFEAGTLAEVVGGDAATALAEAVGRGVLQRDATGYRFVHDRIPESLLAAVDPAGRRRLHQRIALVLDARRGTEPADIYALAQHYADGEVDRTPERAVAAVRAAGRLALEENAPTAGVSFCTAAAAVADAAGITLDSGFRESLAVAYLATGHAEAAREQLEPALGREADPTRRAALRLQLAVAARVRWELTTALEHIHAGLSDLGRPLPRHPARLGITSLGLLLRWLLTGVPRPAPHPATGEQSPRLRLETQLSGVGIAVSAMGLQSALMPVLILRPARAAGRLGAGPEFTLMLSSTGVLAAILRLRRRRDGVFRQAAAMAAQLRDPALSAIVAWLDGYARLMAGDCPVAEVVEVAETHRRWLEVDYYSNTALMQAHDLTGRGYAQEALEWCARGRARIANPTAEALTVYTLAEAAARSLLGQSPDLPTPRRTPAMAGPDAGYWMQYLPSAVQAAVEQDDLGAPFDDAVGVFHQLGLRVSTLPGDLRMTYVYEALGRLARAHRAAPARAELVAATAAVRRLGKAANDPLLRGFHRVAKADLHRLRGRPDRALAQLARADDRLKQLDAPLVQYEAARLRARALRALGHREPATQEAEIALLIANKHCWVRRARWIRREFSDASSPRDAGTRGTGHTLHADGGADRYRRRLDALQQVNVAAASVLDPQRLARIALDETLRILNAERAALFLADADDVLRLSVCRTSGGDLAELTGYSASLVERVAAERRALVVTGGDEGAALGSQSAVVHGLRSIMIAPLELDRRLLGVVYLDSRVAKGVFTDDDVEILTAITSQVAVSLETARAAQLEVAVHAARQQRDTAEALRDALNRLTATLDPDEVLKSLRDIVGKVLAADRVCLIQRDGTRLTITGADREPDTSPATELLDLDHPRAGVARDAPPAVHALLGDLSRWLVAPLPTRSGGRAVLLAGSVTGEPFNTAQLDTAATLAGQGATAYDNARLFAEVRRLATTDALTGVYNRRHFGELAGMQLSLALRNGRPLAGLMVDIDHFKKINDTYGHATGDETIRAVAGVLSSHVREPDVLSRYGGEEFAIVMGEMNGDPTEAAERLRVAVAALAIPGPDGPVHVTVSIGVGELKPDDDLDRLLARADEALYRAKQAGRNRVVAG